MPTQLLKILRRRNTGVAPTFRIMPAVAYEGVDLRPRTRALDPHDLPWTPVDLEDVPEHEEESR